MFFKIHIIKEIALKRCFLYKTPYPQYSVMCVNEKNGVSETQQ